MLASNAMNDQVMQETKVLKLVQSLRWALFALIGLAIGVGVWQVLQSQKRGHVEDAFALLVPVEKLEEQAAKESEAVSKESDKVQPSEVMLKWSDAKKTEYDSKLKAVIANHNETAAGAIAGLKLAQFKFQQKNYPEARDAYRGVISSMKSRELVVYKAMAFEGLGVCLESENNFEEAAKVYAEAIAIKDNPLKPLAYLGSARAFRKLNKADEAKKAYDSLIKEFPGSPYERKAKALTALGE